MRSYTFPSLLIILMAAAAPLCAQTDTLPLIGGIVLDPDTFATVGEPQAVTRSSPVGTKKSLLEKIGIKSYNQGCELSCGSCAVAAAVMVRRKIYCGPRCHCRLTEIFSWSYFHNQLVKMYGRHNIRLKNVLDLLISQGIPLAVDFANTPCSHDRQPKGKDRSNAARFKDWAYQPIFRAKKNIPGSLEEQEALFRQQLVPKTIAWIDYDIPVIVGLFVTESFRSLSPQNCLWEAPASLEGAKGHALLVMGYDDTKQEFELLNSYGAGWGCAGLMRIGYADYTRVVQEGYVIKFALETGKKVDCPVRR